MFPLPEKSVFLPSFEFEDLTKMRRNDRFAYGSVATMRVVMNRVATLLEAGAEKYRGVIDSARAPSPETWNIDMLVTRVLDSRHSPRRPPLHEACRSGEDPMACSMMEAGFKFPADGGSS
eukprot:g12727.t1